MIVRWDLVPGKGWVMRSIRFNAHGPQNEIEIHLLGGVGSVVEIMRASPGGKSMRFTWDEANKLALALLRVMAEVRDEEERRVEHGRERPAGEVQAAAGAVHPPGAGECGTDRHARLSAGSDSSPGAAARTGRCAVHEKKPG